MGVFLNSRSHAQRVTLRARHMVGRSRVCDLRIIEPSVSGEHALIWWAADGWKIRDMGSRNGTFVDESRLPPGGVRALGAQQRVRFGHSTSWLIESVGPPVASAVCVDDERRSIGSSDLLAIPSESHPLMTLSVREDGSWNAESDEEVVTVCDLDHVQVGGARWRLHLPQPLEETVGPGDRRLCIPDVALHFRVSSDEESVCLYVSDGDSEVFLPARAHLYALLTLARLRMRETSSVDDPGWIYRDSLCDQLLINRVGLNSSLFRVRRQMADAGIDGAGQLLERRADLLRIAVNDLSVTRV